MRKKKHEALLAEERLRALAAERERDQLRAIIDYPAQVAQISHLAMAPGGSPIDFIEECQPPMVDCTSAFITSEGKFKCAGALAALPFNPHAGPELPLIRVDLNGVWREVKILECTEVYGWVAEGIDSIEASRQISPRVELVRRKGE